MKKILLFATLVACSLMFFSCEKKPAIDPNQARIAEIKAAAMGTWQGRTYSLIGGEGDLATITFTETKITAVFDDETITVNILAWKCVDAKDVWLDLDRDNTHLTIHSIEGDKMTTGVDTTFGLNVFPSELTRVK